MKLMLSPITSLADLSNQFTEQFHQLKLMFFTTGHLRFKGTNSKYMIHDREMLLKDCSKITETIELPINPEMKTYELEELLEEKFGLFVQVFRKATLSWIETSTTDSRTLHEQNHLAEVEIFYGSTVQDEHIDYREQD